jgi:hypothetical protein
VVRHTSLSGTNCREFTSSISNTPVLHPSMVVSPLVLPREVQKNYNFHNQTDNKADRNNRRDGKDSLTGPGALTERTPEGCPGSEAEGGA